MAAWIEFKLFSTTRCAHWPIGDRDLLYTLLRPWSSSNTAAGRAVSSDVTPSSLRDECMGCSSSLSSFVVSKNWAKSSWIHGHVALAHAMEVCTCMYLWLCAAAAATFLLVISKTKLLCTASIWHYDIQCRTYFLHFHFIFVIFTYNYYSQVERIFFIHFHDDRASRQRAQRLCPFGGEQRTTT